MDIARDAYEALCRARDALDAGPDDGPEHRDLDRQYLKARIQQYNRVALLRPVIDPVPAMNRRFFAMGSDFLSGVLYASGEKQLSPLAGDGRGWGDVPPCPPVRMVLEPGRSFRRAGTLLNCHQYRSTHILPRPLLEIWQRFDPAALDILPVQIEGRRKQPSPQEYFYVDITRRLPAFDLAAMGVFAFRQPKPYADEVELFPAPKVFALRDDLPVEGVHLFRDLNWRGTYFVSAELRQACLDAGFTDLPLRPPETPE